MATATSAYRNPSEAQSAKTAHGSPFNRAAQVHASTLGERYKRLLLAMLSKNRFGDELWLSTESLQVIVGRVCERRKSGFDTRGRRLGTCEIISRRAMQKRIDDAVSLGVLREIYPANVWVGHGKARKFRRSATYELNAAKLVPAKTWDEYHAEKLAAKPSPRRIPSISERSSPPAQEPAKVAPPNAAPVAVAPRTPHRSSAPSGISRPEERVRKLRLEVMAKWDELKRGVDTIVGLDGLAIRIGPGHRDYRPPLSPEKAWDSALAFHGVSEKEAREKLNLSFGKFADDEEAEKSP